jgi:predicted AAA+ superfamily ATPase
MRSLPPYEPNIKKRLIKSPKVFIRDSGILHKLLQITDFNGLMGHPVLGASWEGFVIENIISRFPNFEYFFYRTSSGNEIDLVIQTSTKRIAVECKASTTPQLSKSNWEAVTDINPDRVFVISPITDRYYLNEKVIAIGLQEFLDEMNLMAYDK